MAMMDAMMVQRPYVGAVCHCSKLLGSPLRAASVIPDLSENCQTAVNAARWTRPRLTARGVVADARCDFVVVAGHFDAEASEATVAGGVGGRVVEGVLVAQLV